MRTIVTLALFVATLASAYDDYRQFDFSKDAELLFIEKQK